MITPFIPKNRGDYYLWFTKSIIAFTTPLGKFSLKHLIKVVPLGKVQLKNSHIFV